MWLTWPLPLSPPPHAARDSNREHWTFDSSIESVAQRVFRRIQSPRKKSQWAFFDFCTKLYWQRSTQIWSKSESFQSYLFQIGFFFLFFVENDSSIYFVFSFFFQMSPNSNRSQSFNKTFWQKGKTRKEEEKEKSLILKWIVLSKEKRPWAVLGATFHFPSQTNFTVFLKRLISFQKLAI